MTRASRLRLRWLTPVAAVALIGSTVLLTTAARGSGQPALPSRTAAQLLAAAGQAHVAGMSGTVVQTAALGLPALPAGDLKLGPLSSLLSGSATIRVWYAGPGRERIALLRPLNELDLVHSGREVWTFDSTTNTAERWLLPAPPNPAGEAPNQPAVTPLAAADQLLKLVGPTTAVTVDRTARVAGRPAYQLVFTPRQAGTLIRSVRIALDAATSVPLRVQVWGAGTSPAFQTGFTSVSFAVPPARMFQFTPPRGAKVIQHKLPAGKPHGKAPAGARPAVYGTGWTAVVRVSGVKLGAQQLALVGPLSTPTARGRLLRTALATALLTPDGRLYAGAVTPQLLEQVAAAHP